MILNKVIILEFIVSDVIFSIEYYYVAGRTNPAAGRSVTTADLVTGIEVIANNKKINKTTNI